MNSFARRSMVRFLAWVAYLSGLPLVASVAWSAEALSPRYLIPAGAQRGVELTVQSKATLPRWPIQIWCPAPGIDWKPSEQKGEWIVRVAQDAAVGLHWVRMYDAVNASAMLPFFVSQVAQRSEQEPNDRLEQANPEELPCIVDGQFHRTGDVDVFRVKLAAGDRLVVQMIAHRMLGAPLDGTLQVVLPNGSVAMQVDDALGLDPLLVFEAPEDGDFLVRAFCFPASPSTSVRFAGGDDYRYRLLMTCGPYLEQAQPTTALPGSRSALQLQGWGLPKKSDAVVEACPVAMRRANVSVAGAAGFCRVPQLATAALDESVELLQVPSIVLGKIAAAQEVDTYELEGQKDESLELECFADRLGSALDAKLGIESADTKRPWSKSADDERAKDPTLKVTLPHDGKYRITVSDAFGKCGERFLYRLHLARPKRSLKASVAQDRWTLDAAEAVEISVELNRGGETKPVLVYAERLPPGVIATPVWSKAKAESEKKVALKLRASGDVMPWSGTVRLMAQMQNGRTYPVTCGLPGTAERSDKLWLTLRNAD